jgi:hypothetical protein
MFTRKDKMWRVYSMRNPLLYEALKKFCETALACLNKKAIKNLPSRTKGKVEIEESGGCSYDYVNEIDWDRFIRTRCDIVHSGMTEKHVKIGLQEIHLYELVSRVEDHLRYAIRKFLMLCEGQAKDESDVINTLDEEIISGFQRCE